MRLKDRPDDSIFVYGIFVENRKEQRLWTSGGGYVIGM